MGLVDPEVTQRKVDRELELWAENAETYRARGWIMLARAGVTVDVGFLAAVPFGHAVLPTITACVRFDYTNFDLWPPSVEFIDPFTGRFMAPVVNGAIPTDEGPRALVVGSHPDTNRPFFCVPGTREYHHHPQHSGDSWLLHRGDGEGGLGVLCDRIWRAMARSIIGLQLQLVTLPPETGQQFQLQLGLAMADVDALRAGLHLVQTQPEAK